MDIKDSYLHNTRGVVKSINVNEDKLIYTLADINNTYHEVTLPVVTHSHNGLMSKEDKIKIDTSTGITQPIPYIVGPTTDTTEGNWTGTYTGITKYIEGLTIIYVPNIAGSSTTTLNINNLGDVICYYNGDDKLTTQYLPKTPIILTYLNNGWRRSDFHNKIAQTNINTYDNYRILLSTTTSDLSSTEKLYKSDKLFFNPNTGVLKSSYFNGPLTYNSDLRNVETIPSEYKNKFIFQGIKSPETIGLSTTNVGAWVSLFGWKGYTDNTGPHSWELASDNKQRIHVRSGIGISPSGEGNENWNQWNTLAYLSDLTNYITLNSTQTITGAKTFENVITIKNTPTSAFDKNYLSFFNKESEAARIGIDSNNALGIYAKSTIFIRPNSGFTSSTTGLVITPTSFTYNANEVLTANNYTSYTPIINSSSTHATNSSIIYAPTTVGTSGQILTSSGNGAPIWSDIGNINALKNITSSLSTEGWYKIGTISTTYNSLGLFYISKGYSNYPSENYLISIGVGRLGSDLNSWCSALSISQLLGLYPNTQYIQKIRLSRIDSYTASVEVYITFNNSETFVFKNINSNIILQTPELVTETPDIYKEFTLVKGIKTSDKFFGNLEGNADSATKLNINTIGSETKPVYFNNGIPVETKDFNDYLSLNGGTMKSGALIKWNESDGSYDWTSNPGSGFKILHYNSAKFYGTGIHIGDSFYRMQLVYGASDNNIKFRVSSTSNTSFTDWKILLNETNYNSYSPKLDGTGATGTWGINITGTADKINASTAIETLDALNSFIEGGKIKFGSARSLIGTHIPSDGIVMSLGWYSTNVYGGLLLFNDNTPDIWYRYKNNDWGGWRKILIGNANGDFEGNITGNSNTATTLSNSRTLWGQDFNGSENVSGDMVDVGTINNCFKITSEQTAAKLNVQGVIDNINYIHLYVTSTNSSNTNSRPLVLQNGYGNVGIGVSQPSEKLEVEGNVKATLFIGNINWDYIQNKPDTLPASGGNADTVDNYHAIDLIKGQYLKNGYINCESKGWYTIASVMLGIRGRLYFIILTIGSTVVPHSTIIDISTTWNNRHLIKVTNSNYITKVRTCTINDIIYVDVYINNSFNNNVAKLIVPYSANSLGTLNEISTWYSDNLQIQYTFDESITYNECNVNGDLTYSGSIATNSKFIGNLDGKYINALTDYAKSTTKLDILSTDSLNSALGKLEYKANLGVTVYDWYQSITQDDTDTLINKWGEIVGFLDSVTEGTDILDEFVTRKTNLTITGLKTFQSNSDTTGIPLILKNNAWNAGMSTALDFYNGSAYTVPNARIENKMVGSGVSGGNLIFYTLQKSEQNPNPNGLTERFRIGDNGISTITGNLKINSGDIILYNNSHTSPKLIFLRNTDSDNLLDYYLQSISIGDISGLAFGYKSGTTYTQIATFDSTGKFSGTSEKANKDDKNQQISTTYIKSLSVSDRTITYTKGDDTTNTITIGCNLLGTSFTSGNLSLGEHDADNIKSNGVWYYNSHGPTKEQSGFIYVLDGALYSQAYNNMWVGQIAQDYRSGKLAVRGLNNGLWTTWKGIPTFTNAVLGSSIKPIYINNGNITECDYTLENVKNELSTTTKAYITGTTSETTNTGTLIFDTLVYLTTTPGTLYAKSIAVGTSGGLLSSDISTNIYMNVGTTYLVVDDNRHAIRASSNTPRHLDCGTSDVPWKNVHSVDLHAENSIQIGLDYIKYNATTGCLEIIT